jgi:hypothetical protein
MFPTQLPAWVLSRTIAHQEFATRAALAALPNPVTAYVPERVTTRKISRYCKRREEVRQPAFFTYVIVLVETPIHWRTAFSGYFRVRPIIQHENAITVREEVITQLREMEASGALNTQPIELSWRAGTMVLVTSGYFSATGKVERDAPPGGRVKVVFDSGLRGSFPEFKLTRVEG